MRPVTEGKATCFVPEEQKISSCMDVFYNSAMKENRDMTITFLASFFLRQFSAASLLAGTGMREVRMLKELPLLSFLAVNDGNPHAAALIGKNLFHNACDSSRYLLSNSDASLFLLQQKKAWDYIDIDPFGSPNPFLDAAIKKCRHLGVLGITATDTAAVTGTYPKAAMRKYWSVPLRNFFMHETGIRILLRKIQLIAAQYEKAAVPLFCYFSQHYYRVFVQLQHGKKSSDDILAQHSTAFFCPNCFVVEKKNVLVQLL